LYIRTLINCHASLVCKHDISQIASIIPSSFSHGGAKFSGQGKAEKGEVTLPPYDVIQGRFKISPSELSFSQR